MENFPADSQTYQDLKIIETNANNAKKIVENLLGFARITEGLEDEIDVVASIVTVVSIIKNTLFTKKIELITEITDGLPHVRGDVREFQQVIFNLINNSVAALKAVDNPKVIISSHTESGMVSINVSDNGEGISNKIKPRLFDPFFTTKQSGEGTGLGLSLCYGIIKKLGGKISFRITSKEDFPNQTSGTVFTVSLPIINNEI